MEILNQELTIPLSKIYQPRIDRNTYIINYYGENCKKIRDFLYKDFKQSFKRKREIFFSK